MSRRGRALSASEAEEFLVAVLRAGTARDPELLPRVTAAVLRRRDVPRLRSHLSARLSEYRARLGLSRRALAWIAGVSPGTLARAERGSAAALSTVLFRADLQAIAARVVAAIEGSGNVFRDRGLPDPEARLAEADRALVKGSGRGAAGDPGPRAAHAAEPGRHRGDGAPVRDAANLLSWLLRWVDPRTPGFVVRSIEEEPAVRRLFDYFVWEAGLRLDAGATEEVPSGDAVARAHSGTDAPIENASESAQVGGSRDATALARPELPGDAGEPTAPAHDDDYLDELIARGTARAAGFPRLVDEARRRRRRRPGTPYGGAGPPQTEGVPEPGTPPTLVDPPPEGDRAD